MKNKLRALKERFIYLLKGNLWAFWHYNELGFTRLTFRGIPVIVWDDCPPGVVLYHDDKFDTPRRKDGKLDRRFNINKYRYEK